MLKNFKYKYFYFGLTICLTFFLYTAPLFAGDATLSWEPPTTNSDGTPLTDLAGFIIYYGTATGVYSNSTNVGNVTTYQVGNLTEGFTYYFAITAYDTSRNESEYSNEVNATIQYSNTTTLAVYVSGNGIVRSSPSGIDCPGNCSEEYTSETVVTLTATPDSGWKFSGWSGACSGTDSCTISMTSNKSVTATFIPIQNITFKITVTPITVIFGNVNVGSNPERYITVRNDGSANLIIGTITNPFSPFSIVSDNCSDKTLSQFASCTIIVGFSPIFTGTFNSTFNIPSSDPYENPVNISLSGSATPITITNAAPTKPVITYPPNGAINIPTTLTLKWDKSTDPDGDTVTYKLYIDTDPSFTDVNPVILASIPKNIHYTATPIYQIGIFALFGIIAIGGLSKKTNYIKFFMVAVLLVGGLLIGSCGSGGGNNISGVVNTEGFYAVENLQTGTTYYWKVVADDGNGGIAESSIFSFTTASL